MSRPTVVLESTVIAHGLPYPENLETAQALEQIVAEHGARARTIGILNGTPVLGLNQDQLRHLATADTVRKVSLRDLPVVTARGLDGATTVAATMWLAHRHNHRVFATGGIGGVHRTLDGTPSRDISNDLDVLGRVPMVVVCSGAKAILDLPATREALETRGVTVVGYQTDTLPAFYQRSSGLPVDVRCDTPAEVAALARARDRLGLTGALLVTVPVPEADALDEDLLTPALEQALAEAEAQRLTAAAVTPFLLDRISTLTGAASLRANRALLRSNAAVAATIACALAQEDDA